MHKIENPVLAVVDMQNGFLGEKSKYVIPNVVNLVQECQNHSIPTIFTRFHNQENSPFENLIGWTRLRDSSEVEITDQLKPFVKTVIDKDFYSAFTESFNELVKQNNWKTIIVCGVATESCVMKTAVDAFEKNLTPLVVSDACASHAGKQMHESGLTILGRFIGDGQILTTSELLNEIDSRKKQEVRH